MHSLQLTLWTLNKLNEDVKTKDIIDMSMWF